MFIRTPVACVYTPTLFVFLLAASKEMANRHNGEPPEGETPCVGEPPRRRTAGGETPCRRIVPNPSVTWADYSRLVCRQPLNSWARLHVTLAQVTVIRSVKWWHTANNNMQLGAFYGYFTNSAIHRGYGES